MTAALLTTPPAVEQAGACDDPARTRRSLWLGARLPLTAVLVVQAALWLRPGLNRNACDDEGLYLYMGHRMIDHFMHGTHLQEVPGSYFSGAPGLYPVLGALADTVGGLVAARGLSLAFAMMATIAVYSLGRELFGPVAAMSGALSFVLCGSVIFQSHLATFDAMTMALVASAACVAVRGARRDGLQLSAPLVAVLLAAAGLTKYAGAVYAPVVTALAIAAGWWRWRSILVRRAVFVLVAATVLFTFVLVLWSRELIPGLERTTTKGVIISAAPASHFLAQVAEWAGAWLALAVAGAGLRLRRSGRREAAVVVVLLVGSVIGLAGQIGIGEATSPSKHLGFGMVLAAPLIGTLFAETLARKRRIAAVPVVCCFVGLGLLGLHSSGRFLTGWVDDRALRPVLATAVAANPGRPILGEQPSPQRYVLREQTAPRQWNDTYEFSYAGLSGPSAYERAIREHYFGVVYLTFTTANGHVVAEALEHQDVGDYYHLVGKAPRYLHGAAVGHWLVYTPQRALPGLRVSP